MSCSISCNIDCKHIKNHHCAVSHFHVRGETWHSDERQPILCTASWGDLQLSLEPQAVVLPNPAVVFPLVFCSLALSPVVVSQNGASCDTVVPTGTSGGKRGGYRYYPVIWPMLNDHLTVAHRWALPKRYKPMGNAVQLVVMEIMGTLQLLPKTSMWLNRGDFVSLSWAIPLDCTLLLPIQRDGPSLHPKEVFISFCFPTTRPAKTGHALCWGDLLSPRLCFR